ncbi:alpha-actinin, putative [Entamoeba histolytica HM-3:IMSS]|uniref:Cortexillin, putative n=6 Tax=Entamoeba histolytica TaxID=5759 RepID=B1N341_ENTH1|nr:cortexillin, putative [Entamoeba histolytica HM-1:IMSS]EDS89617.1 cortexillin, putative [Entamoeba histolytica HM-1:IMSS]EMD47976.1 alpha-actinin, putative [Entamoeba histolytica KU27]EMS11076.1 alpha-actinin, putative [Entamoeba histolytica HM-3:IMSS]GAT94143.1 cortexillin putative [Entamoeba histolytica]|eukprot:XP_001913607.1 cortexillin, putative [Entamoeba histolytica HM-1:IMSS]
MSQQQGNNKEAGWVRVQIQLFTLWMDEVLQQRQMGVKDLAVDLKDGIRVINFFELLSGKTLKEKYDLRPKNRIQMVHNLHLAMQFLEKEMLVRNPGCFAEDVVDADIHGVKLILGLLYTLYRKYRLSVLVDKKKGKSMKEEDALLEWVKEVTDGYGVTVENFKHSFNDGKVYLALAHVISNKSFDYDEFKDKSRTEILEKAFSVAEENGIHRLLMVDEVANGDIDERALVLYTSLYHHEYLKRKEMEALQGDVEKNQAQLELEAKSKDDLIKLNVELKTQHETLTNELNDMEKQLVEKRLVLTDLQKKGVELDQTLVEKKESFGKIDLEKNDSEVNLKAAEVLFNQLTEKYENFTAVGEDDKEEINDLTKEIEEIRKMVEERKKQLAEMKEKEGESMASKFVEENKRSAELGDKKTDLVEEIEELEEEVSVLKKTVQTAQDDCDEDKKDLEKAGELQKLYLNIQPLEENLRRQIVDLHKWAPYLKSEEGFGQEDPKLKTLNEPKEGDYKEVFKEMAEDLEKENDEVGKILVQLKKEQLQKEQKKTAKVGVKKPVVKKDKK